MELSDFEKDLFFGIVAVLLAFGLYQTIGLVLATDIPIVSVVSNSMVPAFARGDMIVVQGADFSSIEEGDVVVVENEHMPMPLIHRVVDKSGDTLATQGDANEGQIIVYRCREGGKIVTRIGRECFGDTVERINIEENIGPEQVRGRVVFVIPKLGYAKILPSCLYYELAAADGAAASYTCPEGELLMI